MDAGLVKLSSLYTDAAYMGMDTKWLYDVRCLPEKGARQGSGRRVYR